MKEKNSKALKAAKRAVQIAAAAVLAAVTALVAYIMICNMQGKAASVFGVSVLKVISGSMEPSIHEGDFIIVESTDPAALEAGDIICFYSEDSAIYGMPNTHRIVRMLSDGRFITKGDANSSEDSAAVSADRIIGKYRGKSAFLRWINSFGSLKKLLLLAVIIAAAAVAVYEVKTIAGISSEHRAEKERLKAEEKEKLIRRAIDREKQKLYEQGYDPDNDKKEDGEAERK